MGVVYVATHRVMGRRVARICSQVLGTNAEIITGALTTNATFGDWYAKCNIAKARLADKW